MKRHIKTVLYVGVCLIAVSLFVRNICPASEGFLEAVEQRQFRFPDDHAAHPGFQTEWWYYTGNLVGEDGEAFGFQLTFFRVQLKPGNIASGSPWRSNQLYFAHFTVSDLEHGKFLVSEKAGRGSVGIGGVSFNADRVRVFLHGWEAVIDGSSHRLRAEGDECGVDLELVSEKSPVLHGEKGVSRKGAGGEQASYYYSLTRMSCRGGLRVGNDRLEVTGSCWMDHEFSSNVLSKDQAGWDWMGLQLSGNEELMIYVLRRQDGSVDPGSSGTLIKKDGTSIHLPKQAFLVKPTDFWESRRSGARYPSGWQVEVPPHGMTLSVTPRLKDQELITDQSTQVTYWEGSVQVAGTAEGQRVTGSGYVELTGYAGGFELGFQGD
jgi:predicted secreted hydrolase